MHLLLAQKGSINEGEEAVDLGQTPGEIVFLSAADTELSSLAEAAGHLKTNAPDLRLANLMQLSHPMSVDVYATNIIAKAKLVVVRLLGGRRYWEYGVETLAADIDEAADMAEHFAERVGPLPGGGKCTDAAAADTADGAVAVGTRCALPQRRDHRGGGRRGSSALHQPQGAQSPFQVPLHEGGDQCTALAAGALGCCFGEVPLPRQQRAEQLQSSRPGGGRSGGSAVGAHRTAGTEVEGPVRPRGPATLARLPILVPS